MDAEKRPSRTILMRVVAAGLLAHLAYVYISMRPEWPAGHPWYGLAHIASALAVVAVSVRWSHPKWRSHAMIAALCLAGAAFVFAQQVENRYAPSRNDK